MLESEHVMDLHSDHVLDLHSLIPTEIPTFSGVHYPKKVAVADEEHVKNLF